MRFNPEKVSPKNSVKNYMSSKVGWAVGFIDWLDATAGGVAALGEVAV